MDYSSKLQEVGRNILSWARSSDTSYAQKGKQAVGVYGHYAGTLSILLAQQLLKIESPDTRITGAAAKLSNLLMVHGNYIQHKAPTWQLIIHAYVTYRLIRETIRYGSRVTGIVFRDKKPIDDEGYEEEITLQPEAHK